MNAFIENLRNLPSFIAVTLLNPGWNPKAAWALYSSLVIIIVLAICVGALAAMSIAERRRAAAASAARVGSRPGRRAVPPMSTRLRLTVGFVVLLVLGGIWVVAGAMSSDSDSCKSCHWPSASHARAVQGTDSHSDIACVYCHEAGGDLGRYVTGVPLRLMHSGMEPKDEVPGTGYGRVTVSACSSCHQADLPRTITSPERGLRISHKEPMAASATCIDCHVMRDGVVASYNAGMKQCLRCHDGNPASARCETCHDKNTSAAARVRTTSFQGVQIQQVRCGGCHNEKRQCDPCHGARMPHTTEFMAHDHARAAMVDFWFNDGNGCRRCHTETRRSCRCHSSQIGGAHGGTKSFLLVHKKGTSTKCNTCHARFAYLATRDFCRDVCHSPEAIAASPR